MQQMWKNMQDQTDTARTRRSQPRDIQMPTLQPTRTPDRRTPGPQHATQTQRICESEGDAEPMIIKEMK